MKDYILFIMNAGIIKLGQNVLFWSVSCWLRGNWLLKCDCCMYVLFSFTLVSCLCR